MSNWTGQEVWWLQYGTTLRHIIQSKLSAFCDALSKQWVNDWSIFDPSGSAYLSRYYLVHKAISGEFNFHDHNEIVYLLMASSCTRLVDFGELVNPDLWEGVDIHPTNINHFRALQPGLQAYGASLANESVVSEIPWVKRHATLSSFTLLYGLHLFLIMLVHHQVRDGTTDLEEVITHLFDTVTQLKGTLYHVEK